MAVLSQVGEIIVSSSQRNISSSSPRKTTSVTMQKVTERVGWWAISVMRRSKSSKHGKTMNLFFMFIFRDRYSIFKDSFHWNGRSCRKNAINWVKTPTFQLTFSNSADEKSCVIEINRTSSTFSVDNYLSGWGYTPKFCVSIVFTFSWGHFNSQEKLKTMLMKNFGVTKKEHYG